LGDASSPDWLSLILEVAADDFPTVQFSKVQLSIFNQLNNPF
jgi:hypothetical protein